jgi:hypothetical protein
MPRWFESSCCSDRGTVCCQIGSLKTWLTPPPPAPQYPNGPVGLPQTVSDW